MREEVHFNKPSTRGQLCGGYYCSVEGRGGMEGRSALVSGGWLVWEGERQVEGV